MNDEMTSAERFFAFAATPTRRRWYVPRYAARTCKTSTYSTLPYVATANALAQHHKTELALGRETTFLLCGGRPNP